MTLLGSPVLVGVVEPAITQSHSAMFSQSYLTVPVQTAPAPAVLDASAAL